jgi:polar amino acid transport system substrate-binding protein
MKTGLRFVRFLFPLLIIVATFTPTVAGEKTYRVGVLDFPPFCVIHKTGEYTGILVEVLEKVLKHNGISYTIAGMPPKRLYTGLSTGEIDIYMGVKGVPLYAGKVFFSDSVVADIDLRVYSRKGAPVIQSLEQLKGKKIMVLMGYGYGGLIRFLKDPRNRITLDPTADHITAFRKLKAGRADYVLDYRRPASKAIEEVGLKDFDYGSIMKLDVYFIVSKKTPGAEELMGKIENSYQALKAQGEL